MANQSIYDAFSRFWQHVIARTGDMITTAKSYTDEKVATKVDSTTVATSSKLGLVKSGTDITVDSSGNVSVNDDSHNHVIANVDGLQTALNGKVDLNSDQEISGKKTFYNNIVISHDRDDFSNSVYLTGSDTSGVYFWGKYNAGDPYIQFFGTENDEDIRLTGITDPTNLTDAANKNYVDNCLVGKKANTTGAEIFNDYTSNTADGSCSHAEGGSTVASNDFSHAEGESAVASGYGSHAEGGSTVASNDFSHAEGENTVASGNASHAEGSNTEALDYQHAQGHYNNTTLGKAGSGSGAGAGTAFVIGNGTSASPSNAFRVDYNGKPWAKSTIATTGCDYAEFFEWKDQNTTNEDRRGYFVTLDEDMIKIAEPGDYILGIVSGMPSIAGNGDEDWRGRYVYDDFGAFVYEEFEYEVKEPVEVTNEETGETTIERQTVKKTGIKYKENPDYDPTRDYTHREDRPEWDAVGMLGVLSVRDDGTCQINGYCSLAEGGIATSSESGYRVIKRVNDHIVKVIFR